MVESRTSQSSTPAGKEWLWALLLSLAMHVRRSGWRIQTPSFPPVCDQWSFLFSTRKQGAMSVKRSGRLFGHNKLLGKGFIFLRRRGRMFSSPFRSREIENLSPRGARLSNFFFPDCRDNQVKRGLLPPFGREKAFPGDRKGTWRGGFPLFLR